MNIVLFCEHTNNNAAAAWLCNKSFYGSTKRRRIVEVNLTT